jgi:hypothetical protein
MEGAGTPTPGRAGRRDGGGPGVAPSLARFRRHSDLDLAVASLPPDCQIEELGLAEHLLDAALAAAGEDAIGADLVRLEALPPHWQGRIRDHAHPLG